MTLERVTCDCSVGDECPQGRIGVAQRCTILRKPAPDAPAPVIVRDVLSLAFGPGIVSIAFHTDQWRALIERDVTLGTREGDRETLRSAYRVINAVLLGRGL